MEGITTKRHSATQTPFQNNDFDHLKARSEHAIAQREYLEIKDLIANFAF